MTSIDSIILKSTNPFDNFRSVNFWHKQKDSEPVVESIHQDALATIEETLDQVAEDHRTRTVRIEGDPGSGKTYLLGRLKRTLNSKAFFAYINPFPQSDQIWRHILRYTVDSLVQVPEGQQDSQLMLWLKSLSVFTKRSLKQRIFEDDFWKSFTSDRKKFIKHLKDTYKQAGIYNADNFLGVLHDLTNPELYPLACEWLRGDSLSEDSLKALKVGEYIDSEKSAYETLSNFSRISTETQPIVLCFDQLESIARLPDGSLDLQTLFSVHTKIHDENSNLLIIISSPTDTWRQNKGRIDQSHKDRIDKTVSLKSITLIAAESILASRLYSLHRQANPQPPSPLYPITQQHLEDVFPGGKTNPRNALRLGLNVFQKYKRWLIGGGEGSFEFSNGNESPENEHSELLANFKLRWSEELAKVQQRITKIRHLSSSELIQMLQESLVTLKAEKIKIPLLTGTKFASYSLSYQMPGKPGRIGVVWTEDQNMGTFFHVMEACRKAIEQNLCQTLYLIRGEGLGKQNNTGYKLYTQIFTKPPHSRITPDIVSVHYLATYYDLVKDAREGDLVVRGQTLGLKKLQALIDESKVLHDCPLLQELGIVPASPRRKDQDLKPVKDFLLNLVITQQILGRPTLLGNASIQFPKVDESKIDKLIDQLCQEKKIQILDPRAKPKSQLVCLVPKAS